MKRVVFSLIALAACLAVQAQDIRVNYTGNRPTINDFVTAVLSQDDLGESLDDVKNNWERYQQGKPLAEGSGASFTVDVKNGYVRYEKHLTQKTYGYTEFCYWNCQDARHKLVAVNNGFFAEGQPITTQFSGLTFYTYDNQTKTMTVTPAEDLGAGIQTSAVVGYALPQAGKDIMAVIYAPQGEIQILMKWNGAKFDQQMLGVPDGNVQVSAPASKATGSFGETIQRNGEECIRVYTAEQFLNAIGSYRHILVAKNTEINLTPILNDQSLFRTRFMMWMPDASGGIGGDRATVVSEGWILRLQKNREGVDLPLACLSKLSYTKRTGLNRLHFVYKRGFSFTNLASGVQNWRFVYKYAVFNLQISISPYKLAPRFTTQRHTEFCPLQFKNPRLYIRHYDLGWLRGSALHALRLLWQQGICARRVSRQHRHRV